MKAGALGLPDVYVYYMPSAYIFQLATMRARCVLGSGLELISTTDDAELDSWFLLCDLSNLKVKLLM